MRISLLAAGLLGAGLMMSGCGSTTTTTAPADTASTAAATSSPSADSSPVAADDPCGLLTPDEINQALGTTFGEGEESADEARQIVTCKYTMTDSSTGVELPVAIVNVAVSLIDGQESYKTNVDLASAYFGNESEPVEVPGATKAYVVNNEETQSPVIGMLVGGRFVQVQIGVEGATVEQAQELATTAAARAS